MGTYSVKPAEAVLNLSVVDTVRLRFLYCNQMRVLAVDLGAKRIGAAISDELGITVRGVETIRRTSVARDLARLKLLVEELRAEAVVVGLPLRMDGSIGDAAKGALSFVERLRTELPLEIFTQDERLTSYEAEQIMTDRGMSRAEKRARSDEFAAMIILQDFLSTSKVKK